MGARLQRQRPCGHQLKDHAQCTRPRGRRQFGGRPATTPESIRTPTPTPSPGPTPSPTPSPTPPASPSPGPAPIETLADGSHGYVVSSSAVVRSGPTSQSAVVGRLAYLQQLTLEAKVRGERFVVGDQVWPMAIQDWSNLWYQVDGGYVYAAFVWIPRSGEVIPANLPSGEHWVDVNLGTQTARAMIGDTSGVHGPNYLRQAGYDTPAGHWRVNYQVVNETMTSGQAGINDPAEHYDVHNVLFTQYFDGDGDALHLNYWQPAGVFGQTRTSHGCVGPYIQDAQYLWMFGQAGMRVEIHLNGQQPPAARPAPAAA